MFHLRVEKLSRRTTSWATLSQELSKLAGRYGFSACILLKRLRRAGAYEIRSPDDFRLPIHQQQRCLEAQTLTLSSRAKPRDLRFPLVGRQISGLLTSLAPWTGAPGSHQRTWEEKDGGEAPTKAFISRSRFSYPCSESMRKKTIFNPGTLVRTWGTRPGGKAWREAIKKEDKGERKEKQS